MARESAARSAAGSVSGGAINGATLSPNTATCCANSTFRPAGNSELTAVEKEITRTGTALDRYLNAFENNTLDPALLQDRLEALDARIVEYILLHLSDPSLTPQKIAAAHHISLRHLHRLWSHNERGLAEWIIVERLARAAGALASERQQRRSISAIAYSLGFKDAAHFSRRFRSTYGVPPHLWRREAQHQRGGDARDPGT
jgi:AraC-like DNA-binding protein